MATERKQAARTTIVGGQPPGAGRDLPPIPVALEELLGMAAAEEAFAQALLDDPSAASDAAGLELTVTEGAILRAIDPDTLARMIHRVRAQLPDADRRSFLEQATLALAVLVGTGAAVNTAACGKKGSSSKRRQRQEADTGARPDRPKRHPGQRDAGAGKPRERPRPMPPTETTGARPDRPREPDPRSQVDTGARPDRPAITGSRPVRSRSRVPDPRDRCGTGARPDLPGRKR